MAAQQRFAPREGERQVHILEVKSLHRAVTPKHQLRSELKTRTKTPAQAGISDTKGHEKVYHVMRGALYLSNVPSYETNSPRHIAIFILKTNFPSMNTESPMFMGHWTHEDKPDLNG